jgi:5-(carboxyamino)imidazole ribonucleotide synthase
MFAVEFFVVDGALVVNEIAPRPHNSGHFTIEGCVTSQFENHLRAVLDWPLGSTHLVVPAIATANVFGGEDDPRRFVPDALAMGDVHVHLYGKSLRPGRKLGHVTVCGDDAMGARLLARRAADCLANGPGALDGSAS